MARELVVGSWPQAADILASAFWPGPLTLVLPKRIGIPDEVTAGLATVGVRAPAHVVAKELIRTAGIPLAAPSANPFQHLSPTEAQHVRDSLGDKVDLVLDGGRTAVGIESTVLSLAGERATLLRPGMISRSDIESKIGTIDLGDGVVDPNQSHVSPGLHEKHYSPTTRLLITDSLPEGTGAYIWWNRARSDARQTVHLPAEPAAYAREIYSVLHALDKEGLEFIAVEPVPESDEWAAIRDRLRRASGRK